MNIEKMKQFVALYNELKADGLIGFTEFHKGFHVSSEELKGFENLQLISRSSSDYPFEIFVEMDGFKIFAILEVEQLKEFPQFKRVAKAELLKQLAELEQEEEVTA